MRTLPLLALFLASCATTGRSHAPDSLRISASHYQSMTGVTFKEGEESANCKRERITGSHIPRWYCRFGDNPTQYQLTREIVLDVH